MTNGSAPTPNGFLNVTAARFMARKFVLRDDFEDAAPVCRALDQRSSISATPVLSKYSSRTSYHLPASSHLVALILGRGVDGPVVDHQLVADPQPHAVVADRRERVLFAEVGAKLAGPCDVEAVAHRWRHRARRGPN